MLLEGCACGGALRKTSAQHYRPVSVGQSDNRGQQPRRRSKPMKLRELRLRHLGSGNLQTRLARRRASAQHLCLRYPGRSSYVATEKLAVATSTHPIQCCCGHTEVSSVTIREGGSAYKAVDNRAWATPPAAQAHAALHRHQAAGLGVV